MKGEITYADIIENSKEWRGHVLRTQHSASCMVCGYEKPLAIFLDPALLIDHSYHGVCEKCRSLALGLTTLLPEGE